MGVRRTWWSLARCSYLKEATIMNTIRERMYITIGNFPRAYVWDASMDCSYLQPRAQTMWGARHACYPTGVCQGASQSKRFVTCLIRTRESWRWSASGYQWGM